VPPSGATAARPRAQGLAGQGIAKAMKVLGFEAWRGPRSLLLAGSKNRFMNRFMNRFTVPLT